MAIISYRYLLCLFTAHHVTIYSLLYKYIITKNALARSCKKRSFFLAPLQDLARSCKILWDLAGSCGILQESCRILARNSCKIPARFLQNPTRSRKILQDLARSCKILQECKKKGPFLARSCKSVFTGYVATWRSIWHCRCITYMYNQQQLVL